MAKLKANDRVKMKYGDEAIVISELGSGGQGTVYRVRYNGKEYALKWYHSGVFGDKSEEFYKNLENNITKGAPSPSFLWPLYITKTYDNSFGYLMDLRPAGYYELTDFFVNTARRKQIRFQSFDAVVNAAINIISGFRELHNSGYSYQDINNGNFFIDPKNGNVLICDNDNVSPAGINLGILGKQRYMAPEVVTGKNAPDKQSDRFSLSVILFRLLFINHPLEGVRSTPPCMTKEFERKYYGEEPVFIYDPNITTNRPIIGTDANLKKFWAAYPEYIKQMFIKAFSQDVMQNRENRIIEKEWMDAFFRLKASIVTCPYCHDKDGTFINQTGKNYCIDPKCQKPIVVNNTLKLQSFELPLFPGVRIMHYHIDSLTQDIKSQVGIIIMNPKNPNLFGIKNLSNQIWIVDLPDGTQKEVAPATVMPIKEGYIIHFSNNKNEVGTIN